MSELQDKIVAEAMTWLNTPFLHQGAIKGRGVDCANFVARTICAVAPRYLGREDMIPTDYKPQEDGVALKRILVEEADFVDTADRQKADIIAFCDEACREPDVPRHLVIIQAVVPATTFVIDPTPEGVVRHRLNGWWLKRIHSVWRVRE